jgi:hypothetical protein
METPSSIQKPQIVRRTFEGVNDDPVRSKYCISKKYAVVYWVNGQRKVELCANRLEAADWIKIHLLTPTS